MRRALGGLSVAAALFACVDVFHSTDVSAICDESPGFQECPKTPGPEGYCTNDAVEARRRAEHACAWLSACEGVAESNALGTCITNAAPIFLCSTPGMEPADALHNKWDCLRLAGDCPNVDRCIYGREPVAVCANANTTTSCVAGHIYVVCQGQGRPASSEDCALLGRTCSNDASTGNCEKPCANGVVQCGQGEQAACATCDSVKPTRCSADSVTVKCSDFGLACDSTRVDRCVLPQGQ